MCAPQLVEASFDATKALKKSLTPELPKIPKPPPPPPPLAEKTAQGLETGRSLRDAQRLSGRLGTGQLVVPFSNVNVPS